MVDTHPFNFAHKLLYLREIFRRRKRIILYYIGLIREMKVLYTWTWDSFLGEYYHWYKELKMCNHSWIMVQPESEELNTNGNLIKITIL